MLESFAWANVALVFDYDGTLAPIVGRPDQAALPESTQAKLRKAVQLYPCAVLSGRAHGDVAKLLEGVPLTMIVGNHGAEWEWKEPDAAKVRAEVRGWQQQLAAALAPYAGVVVENKRLSLTIHYRHATARREALRAIRAEVGRLRDPRILGGKECVNVVPRSLAHKGHALRRILSNCRCDAAVYVGDDDTDEDVFALTEPWLLGIRVGRGARTSARFFLRRQKDVDALLEVLIDCRRRPSRSSG